MDHSHDPQLVLMRVPEQLELARNVARKVQAWYWASVLGAVLAGVLPAILAPARLAPPAGSGRGDTAGMPVTWLAAVCVMVVAGLMLVSIVDGVVYWRFRRPLARAATASISGRWFEVEPRAVEGTEVVLRLVIDPARRRYVDGLRIPLEGCTWLDGTHRLLPMVGLLRGVVFQVAMAALAARRQYLAVRLPSASYDAMVLSRNFGDQAVFRLMPRP